MMRAGMMRKVATGVYSYLPLGLRTLKKVENIVRYHMDKYGAQQGGGQLYTISPGQFVSEIDNWCFAAERAVGDYAIIENAYGYSLCYISLIS